MAAAPNIYIIGSQCTGKTTLCNAVSEYLNQHPATLEGPPGAIKEVARTILKNHGFTRGDIRSSQDRTLELQRLIIEGQFEAEKTELQTHSWFISDRSGFDPIIYARKYVSKEAADGLVASPKWREMRDRMAKSLIIVCVGEDWLRDDGVRLMPLDKTEWRQLHAEFCSALAGFGLEYHILPSSVGDRDERVQFVLERWEEKRTRLIIGADEDGQTKASR
ncbi:hypothetical protein NUW58_g4510 [Xylaria curta]|uniref:Uncharacterized protein n=1 Tax=Xylaria curta TaxID=42375 RepID=A0ACC1P8L6_9PEZI|nr:hypothetical protein NUW58_g4510 [Xylaria curta]